MRTTLVLSAESYPWDLAKEQTFLEPELVVLAQSFEQVIVAPQQLGGARVAIPGGVEVDESYAREAARLSVPELLARAGSTTLVAEELVRKRQEILDPASLKRLAIFAGRAHHSSSWARRRS